MKRSVCLIIALFVIITIISSCTKNEKGNGTTVPETTTNRIDTYEKVTDTGYSFIYDDELFEKTVDGNCDSYLLKNSDDKFTGIRIYKFEGKSDSETADEFLSKCKDDGFVDVSVIDREFAGIPGKNVSCISEGGTKVYDCSIIQKNGITYAIEITFLTDASYAGTEAAIMETVHSFKIK